MSQVNHLTNQFTNGNIESVVKEKKEVDLNNIEPKVQGHVLKIESGDVEREAEAKKQREINALKSKEAHEYTNIKGEDVVGQGKQQKSKNHSPTVATIIDKENRDPQARGAVRKTKEISSPITPASPVATIDDETSPNSVAKSTTATTTMTSSANGRTNESPITVSASSPASSDSDSSVQLVWNATKASQVLVSGSFWNWEKFVPMTQSQDGESWVYELPTPVVLTSSNSGTNNQPGSNKFEYKFIVDGEWMYDFTRENGPNESGEFYNNFFYV